MRVTRRVVTRIDVDTATADQRRRAKTNRTAEDIASRGLVTADDMRTLFIALAQSVGLDARIAATSNRAEFLQTPAHSNPFFLDGFLVAVRNGDAWTFVDHANEHSATGEGRWYYTGRDELILNSRHLTTV